VTVAAGTDWLSYESDQSIARGCGGSSRAGLIRSARAVDFARSDSGEAHARPFRTP
jgi:hypothetical protein